MPETTAKSNDQTSIGSYFVSNYPPYSFWSAEQVREAEAALDRPPANEAPLGVYLHIPFCRKRCRFCYFKVYTDKKADEIGGYLDSVIEELRLLVAKPAVQGRRPKFIYFGGGTPSYISTTQLRHLTDSVRALLPWDRAEEVAFECEPGTITRHKLEVLRDIGVTRLSLGVENFNQEILEVNGRAHGAAEIDRAYGLAREVGFPQINIDLISGMIGETDENWRDCLEKTVAMAPESVTIYQMELPPNTVISKEMRIGGKPAPVAHWTTKRRWHREAFEHLETAGYTITSGYTAVRDADKAQFLYRDLLWSGADMLGLGVASFSHMQGVHYQNETRIETYQQRIAEGELPLYRGLRTTAEERMLREFILQMKKGRVDKRHFVNKYDADVQQRFEPQLAQLEGEGLLHTDADRIALTRDGLLRVDELLHRFFLPEHRAAAA
ncbi:MAG: radical SAM protein [Acidobacteria bacterium]|nr:radical SAM protein [Acidobacteriota bacterium]